MSGGRGYWWLRDVCFSDVFAFVDIGGGASYAGASSYIAVRVFILQELTLDMIFT